MVDTSESGFASIFVAKASEQGVAISPPTIQQKTSQKAADSNPEGSSNTVLLIVVAVAGLVACGICILIGRCVYKKCEQTTPNQPSSEEQDVTDVELSPTAEQAPLSPSTIRAKQLELQLGPMDIGVKQKENTQSSVPPTNLEVGGMHADVEFSPTEEQIPLSPSVSNMPKLSPLYSPM